MNQFCVESDHFLAGFMGRDIGIPDFSIPPPFFGMDKEELSSEASSNNLHMTSLESSLLSMEPRSSWEDLSSDNASLSPPTQERKPDHFPCAMTPFTGAPEQPLNHFVSIAFSPHQLSHLPQSQTPIEALHLTPSSLYPYTVMACQGSQHQRETDHSRKFVRKLMFTKPRSMSAASTPASKKAVRTILQQSKPTLTSSRSSESVDHQDGGSVKRRFCHVCRSAKEVSKVVVCSSGKQSHVFCSSCVRRRLGLEFETLLQLADWICPKCNDQCPCSKCRKK
jgi:hypothetical protein